MTEIFPETNFDDKEIFGKRTLVKYIQSNCDRQLFLELGKDNPQWISPMRDIAKSFRPTKKTELLTNEGKKFEQKIYKILKEIPGTQRKEDKNEEITRLSLNLAKFQEYYKLLLNKGKGNLILLEHEIETPKIFIEWLFPNKNASIKPYIVPVKYADNRPDVMILTKYEFSTETNQIQRIRELLPDGHIHIVTAEEQKMRIGINVIDIKNTDSESVGKKHFIEILYYLRGLAFYLQEHHLQDKFFVNVDGNGIFAQKSGISLKELKLESLEMVQSYITLLRWDETYRLIEMIFRKIHILWNKAPCSIESIDVNIQPSCGYCPYLQDCIMTLGKDGIQTPEKWSLKLIPYTSHSIAQQLLDHGMATIGDVYQNLPKLKLGTTPEPLHPELPLLNLKTAALIKDEIIIPNIGQSYSFALPRNTDINITFAAEADPSNDRVFAIGILFSASSAPKSHYALLFDEWWKVWRETIENEYDTEKIQEKLQAYFSDMVELEDIEVFRTCLTNLKGIQIRLKGDLVKDIPVSSTQITYRYSSVNQSLNELDAEENLAKNFIIRLDYLMQIASILEKVIVIEAPGGGYSYSPDTSLFYWSPEQLKNIQEMFERNLQPILSDPKIKPRFDRVIGMMTPNESEVEHPYRYMKLYNLQMFVETILGYPGIINCTWHDLARTQFDSKFNSEYWIPHFNFMDFHPWHAFLEGEEGSEKRKKDEEEIKKQILQKVNTVNRIRYYFQQNSRNVISRYSKPIKNEVIQHKQMGQEYHLFAQIWYTYSKLTGALDEWELDQIRTAYPEYAIGKMVAAEVYSMRKVKTAEKEIKYHLLIRDLSSNMKITEGDRLLLIPDQMRDRRVGKWGRIFTVTIATMNWDQTQNGYQLVTEPVSSDLQEKAAEFISGFLSNTKWFLFPTSMDAWTNKLYNSEGLLQKFNLGTSWLGHRLSRIWEINKIDEPIPINQKKFNASEIYFYYPEYFYQYSPKDPIEGRKLKTQMIPPPDKSQSIAIFGAMDNVIYGIQGPPGTGKSQTIVALIDEFIIAREGNAKILVTAFSYAAIYVLIEKIRNAKDQHNNYLPVAKAQLIFVRSEGRDPIENTSKLPFVNDLLRTGTSWKWNGKSREITPTKKLDEKLESVCIIFANAHQLFHLSSRLEIDFGFDMILVDEGSQLPTDQFLASIQYCHNYEMNGIINLEKKFPQITFPVVDTIKNWTKVVIVGDYNQLPPVQTVEPPEKLKPILDSLFTYYVRHHKIPNNQIQVNYRSHNDIVEYTAKLGIYTGLKAADNNSTRVIKGNLTPIVHDWIKEILDPQKVVCSIFHERKYELAISPFEADLVKNIIIGYIQMNPPASKEEEIKFWQERVGIVAPHNAQGRLIIHQIFETLIQEGPLKTHLSPEILMQLLKSTVYSVEKFQGSDRDLIIASVGISDLDQLRAEAEFIYDLNRFNVLTSRAKSKLIFICSETFLDYIPDERQTMEYASKMRFFAVDFCNTQKIIFPQNELGIREPVVFRWKSHTEEKSIIFPHLNHIKSQEETVLISHQAISELIEEFQKISGITRIEHSEEQSNSENSEVKIIWSIPKSVLIYNLDRIPLPANIQLMVPEIHEFIKNHRET